MESKEDMKQRQTLESILGTPIPENITIQRIENMIKNMINKVVYDEKKDEEEKYYLSVFDKFCNEHNIPTLKDFTGQKVQLRSSVGEYNEELYYANLFNHFELLFETQRKHNSDFKTVIIMNEHTIKPTFIGKYPDLCVWLSCSEFDAKIPSIISNINKHYKGELDNVGCLLVDYDSIINSFIQKERGRRSFYLQDKENNSLVGLDGDTASHSFRMTNPCCKFITTTFFEENIVHYRKYNFV